MLFVVALQRLIEKGKAVISVRRSDERGHTNHVPDFIRRRFLHILFASTSGHTEYVMDALIDCLGIAPGWEIEKTMAEKTRPQDLLRGDVLLLASATWNTGSIEGQLNPHMWVLLQDKAKNLDLAGKPCACIGLGDDRYFYTARSADDLEHYVKAHHGRLILGREVGGSSGAVRCELGPRKCH